jgi:hypothetical protein
MQRLRLKDGAPDEPDSGDCDAYASNSSAASAMLARISCFMTAPAGELSGKMLAASPGGARGARATVDINRSPGALHW